MTHPALIALHALLSWLLFWSCFCRATLMSGRSTRRDVRLAFFALSIAAVVSLFAPLVWDWRPDQVSLSLLIGITVVQYITSRHWRGNVPEVFRAEAPARADARTHHGAARAVPPGADQYGPYPSYTTPSHQRPHLRGLPGEPTP
jgi:hypothetical protein